MPELTVTLCYPETGGSESLPVDSNMTLGELMEFAVGLLGIEIPGESLGFLKDGRPLSSSSSSSSLSTAGIVHGDLLVVARKQSSPPPAPAAAAPAPAVAGGLDFSSLLAGAASSSSTAAPPLLASGGLNFGNLLASAPPAASTSSSAGNNPIYFHGMTLEDAVANNPHPNAIVKVLQEHEHLFKELNYHNPPLARKLVNQPYKAAVEIWRNHMVQSSISAAANLTKSFHTQKSMTERLNQNPNDEEAKAYFDKKRKQQLVHQQYQQAMQEYPESMGRVLMLYIEATINGHKLQAFVDSGAQTTIMSKRCATDCGLLDYVDTRFAGFAVGVGTGKILGRIHIVQLQIADTYFPCSVTVMDDMTLPSAGPARGGGDDAAAPKPKDMDFLLGLDMLKRHLCSIDLERYKLRFRLSAEKYLETDFLHEKDLDESKGGTRGFDAEKANQALEALQTKAQEEQDQRRKHGNNKTDNDDDDDDFMET